MTYDEVYTLVSTIPMSEGKYIPAAYYQFPENDPDNPAPPFICYYFEGSDDFAADNCNYQKIRPLTLELYTDNKDFSLEETVEATLNGAGLVFSRTETYIGSERMYMVVFSTDIIISEGEQENG